MSTFPHVVVFTYFFSLTPEKSSCSSQSCIRFMISHNLESLALYFQGVLPNVLPLAPLVIKVEEVGISGHQLLSQLVNCLSTPKLKKLNLYIDPRESAGLGLQPHEMMHLGLYLLNTHICRLERSVT